MEHFSNDQENHHKLCNDMTHPVVNLMERQWKLRHQHDLNFPMEEKSLQNKYQHQKKEIQKMQICSPGSQ